MADLCELGHGLAAPVAAALIRARAALAGVAGEAVEAVAHACRALAETETETETEAETETEIDAHRGSFLLVVNQRRSSYTHTRSIAVTLCGSRGDHRFLHTRMGSSYTLLVEQPPRRCLASERTAVTLRG